MISLFILRRGLFRDGEWRLNHDLPAVGYLSFLRWFTRAVVQGFDSTNNLHSLQDLKEIVIKIGWAYQIQPLHCIETNPTFILTEHGASQPMTSCDSTHLSENDMAVIQPGGFDGTDEKLGAVCVFASVGHANPSSTVML